MSGDARYLTSPVQLDAGEGARQGGGEPPGQEGAQLDR